jgi:AraC-like DNA-binding protein
VAPAFWKVLRPPLLVWAKLLHAGRWLADPGRSAESVSRQLEYSSGAAFRRAQRTYVGATPTQAREGGGLRFVLRRFLDACGLGDSVVFDRSVA